MKIDLELGARRSRTAAPLPGRVNALLDTMIARHSLVSTHDVLDVRDFGWTADLRANWRAVRDEALGLALEGAPSSRAVFLWGHGREVDANLVRCASTAAVVETIPGLDSAYFSILAPGARIPAHRGPTKGLITCHLGLIVPRDGDARMRVGDRVLRWAEGETLVFDDTCDHEVWNETSGTRVVLVAQFRRPLRNPGRWVADRVIETLRRTALLPALS